jgi:hypothetical protein
MGSIAENGGRRPSEAAQGDNIVTPIDGFRNRSTEGQEDVTVSLDLSPLVKPGVYSMVFVSHRTALCFGTAPKIALKFRIADQGEFFGIELERWYNAKRLIGKPCKGGCFHVAARSDFVLEYLTLFTDPIRRLDRITLRPFKHCMITGRIETVTQNAKQRALPDLLQYSVIRELLRTGA